MKKCFNFYSLVLIASCFTSQIYTNDQVSANQTKQSVFKKIIKSKWFKIGAAVTVTAVSGYTAWLLRGYIFKTSPSLLGMEQKVAQQAPKEMEAFTADILRMKNISYYDNEDVFNAEKERMKNNTEATVEKQEDGWYLILTYNEPGQDIDGRCFKWGYFSGTKGDYHVEYRIPKKYTQR